MVVDIRYGRHRWLLGEIIRQPSKSPSTASTFALYRPVEEASDLLLMKIRYGQLRLVVWGDHWATVREHLHIRRALRFDVG